MAAIKHNKITILPLNENNAAEAFSLACKVFVDASVLHTATGVGIEEYQSYMKSSFMTMISQGLSLVAIDNCSNEIIACIVACDYHEQVHSTAIIPETLKPINAILQRLDDAYRAKRPLRSGQCMLIDMAVVSPSARGQQYYRILRESVHQIGLKAGYERVVGELSSAATQHLCINRFHHNVYAEIEYASFEFNGNKPFSAIKEPPSILLVEGELR